MNTPRERLTRTTFSLPLGEVHALVGGAVNARPLLFLHGFPDHPPTAVPFLEPGITKRAFIPMAFGLGFAIFGGWFALLSWLFR